MHRLYYQYYSQLIWHYLPASAKLLLLLLLLVLPTQAAPRNHVIILDASGSIRERYANGLRDWLIAPLLSSGAFSSGDRVILRTFDKRGNKNFLKDDPQRRYNSTFNKENILATVPAAAEITGRFTAIAEALELGLVDLQTYNFTGDTFIWLITDNVQDVSGSGDDPISPFYERIYNDAKFRHIYFFPIVREGDPNALVMYMLHYNQQEQPSPLTGLMDDVSKAIGQRAVLFRPIRLSSLELDRSSIQLESDDGGSETAELEDGRIVIPLASGHSLAGRIKFKLRSRFREWQIEQAEVSNAQVAIDQSEALDLSSTQSLQWQLDPHTIDLGPQETSKKIYSINLASGQSLMAVTPSLLQTFWLDPEVKVNGLVNFQVKSPKLKLAFFDNAELADRIKRVKGLEEIEQFLLPRNANLADRDLTLEIPITIKVAQPPKPIWLVVLLGLLVVSGIVGAFIILRSQTYYRLKGPEGERLLKLGVLANIPLNIADEQVGIIVRRLGSFTIKTFPPYILDNGGNKQRLSESASNFTITNSDTQRTWNFSLESMSNRENEPTSGDMYV